MARRIEVDLVDKGYAHSGPDLVIDGQRCFTGFTVAGDSGRQEYQGPLVPGPWGYIGYQATVISLHHIEEPEALSVEVGDVLVADGVEYRIIEQTRSRSHSDHYGLEVLS